MATSENSFDNLRQRNVHTDNKFNIEGRRNSNHDNEHIYKEGYLPNDAVNGMHTNIPQNVYTNPGDYASAVQQWMWQYQCWNSMNQYYMTMPSYMMSQLMIQQSRPTIHVQVGQPATSQASTSNTVHPVTLTGHPPSATAHIRGVELSIPSIWRRISAEVIDFFLLFVIKFFITMMVIDYVDFIDLEKYDITNLLYQEIDYDLAFTMTTELVIMEIINKIFVCIFETLCLRQGIAGQIGGTTPGKRVMGIKVVSCESIVNAAGNKVIVTPAADIGFNNALMRAVVKNFSLAFFLPVCLTVFFFDHNRAGYDITSSCVCVDMTEQDYEIQRRLNRR